jgi:hypothetical protein
VWTVLFVAAAQAEPPAAYVRGAGAVRAMALLIERDGVVAAVRCHDGVDDPADGDWVCAPLPPVVGTTRLGLVRDGRALDGGELGLSGADLYVEVRGGALLVGASPFDGPGAPVAPSPGLPTLLARVTGANEGSAPVLRLQGAGGSSEIWCRDDGVFPDRIRNDGEQGCAGPAPGATLSGRWGAEVFLNAADGSSRSFGPVTWEPTAAVGFATLDVVNGALDPAAFPIPGIAPDAKPESEAPVPIPVSPEAPTPPPPPPEDRGPAPVDTRAPVETRGLPPLALVAAALLGGLGVVALRWRTRRLPRSLVPHPSPAMYPGGPTFSEPAVWLKSADPAAVVRAVLPILARTRRVVFVAGDLVIPPVDGPVYRCTATDCEAVEAAARALARTPGPPLTVLLLEGSLDDQGAVAPDPAGRLRDGLPATVNVIVAGSGPGPGGFAAHDWPVVPAG